MASSAPPPAAAWRSHWWSMTTAFLFLPWLASASISIVDTGQTYESKPDYRVGQRLWKGYEYMGRMQYLPDNFSLCPQDYSPDHRFTIVKPQDGLPVALIASSGDCSLKAKALVATGMISPPGVVQYLIVRDSSKRLGVGPEAEHSDNYEEDEDDFDDEDILEEFDDMFYELSKRNHEHKTSLFNQSSVTDDESYEAAQFELFQKGHRQLKDYGEQPPVAILHVSSKVGNVLMNIVNTETQKVKLSGGTKILLNGAGAPRTLIMWLLAILLLCACGCCCMIMAVQTGLEEEQPQAPRRPARRRLTLQQVRARFPAFHFNPDEHHQNGAGGEGAVSDQYCQLLDECTICLDEFHAGVRCRQLPCQHVFHSTCIARWLIERSAVCPLCKLDLYEEEEEDDESEGEDENQATEMQPLFSRIFQSTSRQRPQGRNEGHALLPQQQELTQTTTNTTATDPSEARSWWPFSVEIAPAPSRDEHSDVPAAPSIWSRWNLFGSRRPRVHVGDVLTTEMTEPLIAETSTQQTQILQPQHSLEEVTFSPSSPASTEPVEVEATPDANTPEPIPGTTTMAEV